MIPVIVLLILALVAALAIPWHLAPVAFLVAAGLCWALACRVFPRR